MHPVPSPFSPLRFSDHRDHPPPRHHMQLESRTPCESHNASGLKASSPEPGVPSRTDDRIPNLSTLPVTRQSRRDTDRVRSRRPPSLSPSPRRQLQYQCQCQSFRDHGNWIGRQQSPAAVHAAARAAPPASCDLNREFALRRSIDWIIMLSVPPVHLVASRRGSWSLAGGSGWAGAGH